MKADVKNRKPEAIITGIGNTAEKFKLGIASLKSVIQTDKITTVIIDAKNLLYLTCALKGTSIFMIASAKLVVLT